MMMKDPVPNSVSNYLSCHKEFNKSNTFLSSNPNIQKEYKLKELYHLKQDKTVECNIDKIV